MRGRRRCSCINNTFNHPEISSECKKEMIENACDNIPSQDSYNQTCSCGFNNGEDMTFPTNPMLGQSYVPIQIMNETFKPCVGLTHGTIFPELVSTYCPGDSMRQIEYLRRTNEIGEGCNG